MVFRIVLDMFSGRPNPEWTLSEAESAELQRRLEVARASPASGVMTFPDLGYRGFSIRLAEDKAGSEIARVFRGKIALEGNLLRDVGAELQRWLLESGRGRIDPAIFEMIRAEAAF